jgi:hypothetical protein
MDISGMPLLPFQVIQEESLYVTNMHNIFSRETLQALVCNISLRLLWTRKLYV